jgi:hypothetical protein
MGDTDFVGSHEKALNGYGQPGYQGPASVPTGKQPKLGEPKVAPPAISASAGDWQTRDLNAKTAKSERQVPVHDSMRSRNHEGGTIPPHLTYVRERKK